jgi:hypothetical protein
MTLILLHRYATALLELADNLDALELAEGLEALADYLGAAGDGERARWREDYAARLRGLLPSGDCYLEGSGGDEPDVFDEGRPALALLEAGHGALFDFIRNRLFRPRRNARHAAVARRELLELVAPLVNTRGGDDQSQLIGRALLVVYMLQLRCGGIVEMTNEELMSFQLVFNRRDDFTFPISSAADRLWVREMQNVMFRESLDGLVASAAESSDDAPRGLNLEEVAAVVLAREARPGVEPGLALVELAHTLAALGHLFGHGDGESRAAWRRAVEASVRLALPGPSYFTAAELKAHLPQYLGGLRVEELLADVTGRLPAFADAQVRKALLKRGCSLREARDHFERLLGTAMRFIAVLALRRPAAQDWDDEERQLFEDVFEPPMYDYAFAESCPQLAFLGAADAVVAAIGRTRFADAAEESAASAVAVAA